MVKNIAASVNARLRNLAKTSGADTMTLQRRYAQERLLYRLTQTRWGESLVLKGAMIFVMYYGDTHRPTADIDLSGHDANGNVDTLEQMIRDAIAVECDDGVTFDDETLDIRYERDGAVAGGKITLTARIDTSRIVVRVDAGFGNPITPIPLTGVYPAMLEDMPKPTVQVYPLETMIAEKLHAMSRLGAESSRIRDYYDLWALQETRHFNGQLIAEAIQKTFAIFGQVPPKPELDGLSDRFVNMWTKEWDKFCKQKGLAFSPPHLGETVQKIGNFLTPILEYLDSGAAPGVWNPDTKSWSNLAPTIESSLSM
ncbi:nucleotidyl transferase AbiEii/AbiGii toxin family protein [Thalassospira xiamenensis]|uniref:Predicted nucleotidyltransferase component of viral defense system n=1 Tax=Thalassospira xiamenensis TaxID=220697 RepID=A0A285TXZ4_9PROT|nr:nucleotidyl transferase AbiEii/AbiGii toxin family protein [Thalassospira xiamenensis]SOC27249.1 Predicted nucleotidyltransferase component of viral defense system [Thalassospira xiamenensis]